LSGRRVAIAALGAAATLASCGGHHSRAAPPVLTNPSTTVSATTTRPARQVATCPLTGLPAPGGVVPPRPALAVKVENLPIARPQYGFPAADVVYEEPVEGGITRFIVIYQCHDAARVEPVRSGRFIDVDIVRQYGAHPLFAYAGAIQPVVAAVDSSPLVDVSVFRASPAYWRDSARFAPHNLVASTGGLFAAGVAQHAPQAPPPPVFQYGPLRPGSTATPSVHIAYQSSDQTWTWEPGLGVWARSYTNSGPAPMAEGGQIATTNVVVMKVVMYPSPYVEDITGAHENLLVLTGSGPVQVFRGGAVITGTWQRSSLTHQTELLDAAGHRILLAPGQTWVELVPTTIGVTVTP
jgi:hypothetical protein